MTFNPGFEPIPNVADLIERPFGEFVRAIRKEFGLNQSEAASAFGVSQPTICRWEKGGQEPTLDSLKGCQDLLRRYKAARAGQGALPEPTPHIDPEREKLADKIAEDAGFRSPPQPADLTIPELTAEGPFLGAIDTYAEALEAHRAVLTEETGVAVGLARQGLIEAHLAGARMRAVGLAEAMRAWNVEPEPALQQEESIPLRKPHMTFGELAGEGLFEEALKAYDAAVAASYEARDLEADVAAGEARKALLAAHKDELFQKSATIAGLKAQISAAEAKSKQAEAERYRPDPLDELKASRLDDLKDAVRCRREACWNLVTQAGAS